MTGFDGHKMVVFGVVRMFEVLPNFVLPVFKSNTEEGFLFVQDVSESGYIDGFLKIEEDDVIIPDFETLQERVVGDKALLAFEIDQNIFTFGSSEELRQKLSYILGASKITAHPFSMSNLAEFCRSREDVVKADILSLLKFPEGGSSKSYVRKLIMVDHIRRFLPKPIGEKIRISETDDEFCLFSSLGWQSDEVFLVKDTLEECKKDLGKIANIPDLTWMSDVLNPHGEKPSYARFTARKIISGESEHYKHIEKEQSFLNERTIRSKISCTGVGLNSGMDIALSLCPAPPGNGIIFRRTDLALDIPSSIQFVLDTSRALTLGIPGNEKARVRGVEHILSALHAYGVTNVYVEVDGPEIPVLDGSAAPFSFLIESAGISEQSLVASVFEILKPVRVERGLAFAELRPKNSALEMFVKIDFDVAIIGRQEYSIKISRDSFVSELAFARDFVQASEIENMREMGLVRGGSLSNTVVVENSEVLNPDGLRAHDEFVRHKVLDAIGDLALVGAQIQGSFVSYLSGHSLNLALLRSLFADKSNWRVITPTLQVKDKFEMIQAISAANFR